MSKTNFSRYELHYGNTTQPSKVTRDYAQFSWGRIYGYKPEIDPKSSKETDLPVFDGLSERPGYYPEEAI
jgi:hypothetical protein